MGLNNYLKNHDLRIALDYKILDHISLQTEISLYSKISRKIPKRSMLGITPTNMYPEIDVLLYE